MVADDAPTVRSAQRAMRILEVLGLSPRYLSLAELQEATGYPRTSLHSLMRTLRQAEWIESDSTGFKYRIGPRALLVGTSYLDNDPALSFAQQSIERLRSEINHTVHFGRLSGSSVIYLASLESSVSVRMVYRIGRQAPASLTGIGQALLAELTDSEVAALLPVELPVQTERSLAGRAQLVEELGLVRGRGWSLEQGQGIEGVGCIAAAVRYRIPATDAISCSFPLAAITTSVELERLAGAVVRVAEALAQQLRVAGVR